MIKIEAINTFNKFLKLEPVWNDALSKSDVDMPFLTFEWLSCWWKSYCDGNKLLILIAKRNNELLGIAPFMITKTKFRGLPVREISFLTNAHSNRAGFILVKNQKEVVNSILQYLNLNYKFALICCNYILSGSASDNILGEVLNENKIKYKRSPIFLSPYITIDCEWSKYLNSRPKSFRKNLRRIGNFFERNGPYEIVQYSNHDVKKGIDDLLNVSKNTWKHKNMTSIASIASDIKFYTTLSEIAESKGWLNLWVLKLNSKPIAFELNLFYKTRFLSLKIGFDEMYRNFSPGVFLDNYVIKTCFASGAQEFDLLGENEEYKSRWANSYKEHCQYYIFNNSFYSGMLHLLECKIVPMFKKFLFSNDSILTKLGINKKTINMFESIIKKVIFAYKSGGSATVLYRTFTKIRFMLFKSHRSYWYARYLSDPIINVYPRIDVSINFAPMVETLEWEKKSRFSGDFYSEDYKEIDNARKNNHCFINVKHGNKIIGFLKVGFHKVYFKEYMKIKDIPKNTAFIYDTFIHQDYRGMRIAPYMINEAMKRLTKDKLEFIMCHITPTNLASQKAYEKIGFKRIGFIWHLRVFGFKIFNFRPESLMKKFIQKAKNINKNGKTNKVNIIYIIDYFTQIAGSEKNVFDIATKLNPEKHNPIIICLKGGKLVELLRSKGIEVIDLKLDKIYSLDALIKAVKLYKIIKTNHAKIVVTYHEGSDFWGGLVAKFSGVTVIISSRRDMGYDLKKKHFFIYSIINNLVFTKIITVSKAVKNMLIEEQSASESKIITIYNGVDIEKFSIRIDINKMKESLGLNSNNPVVGILAALRPIKGHKYFLEAASIVIKSSPETQFLIVGWNEESDRLHDYFLELKNFAMQLGIAQNVIFAGGRSDIPEILSIMDVSVFSSINEGFSNAVLESMAASKPVVATNTGGTPEAVIDGKTGFLVPPKDAEALANAISYLLKNKQVANNMGNAGRKMVENNFSSQNMLRKLDNLYDVLLEEELSKFTLMKVACLTKMTSVKFIKSILSVVLYYSGIIYLFRKISASFLSENGVKILAYHRVNDNISNPLRLNTPSLVFQGQIKYLKQHYNIISLNDAVQILRSKKKIPNSVVITFDDGYEDSYENAFPIIKKYSIPATIFLTVEPIALRKFLWYEEIREMIIETNEDLIDLRPFGLYIYWLNSLENKENAISEIVEHAKRFNKKNISELIEYLSRELKVNINESRLFNNMLDWEQIKEMRRYGVSFGAHTMSHTILSNILYKEAEQEILDSKKLIEEQLGEKVSFFAYPNGEEGDFNEEIVEIVKNSGFSCACTLIPGRNNTNLFTLKRKNISANSGGKIFTRFSKAIFAAEMSGIFNFLKRQ